MVHVVFLVYSALHSVIGICQIWPSDVIMWCQCATQQKGGHLVQYGEDRVFNFHLEHFLLCHETPLLLSHQIFVFSDCLIPSSGVI